LARGGASSGSKRSEKTETKSRGGKEAAVMSFEERMLFINGGVQEGGRYRNEQGKGGKLGGIQNLNAEKNPRG